jgi:hypothetical protein
VAPDLPFAVEAHAALPNKKEEGMRDYPVPWRQKRAFKMAWRNELRWTRDRLVNVLQDVANEVDRVPWEVEANLLAALTYVKRARDAVSVKKWGR